jgi:hypothetical protein
MQDSGCRYLRNTISHLEMQVVLFSEINDRGGSAALIMRHPSIRKSWHQISPRSGGRSVGIVRLRAKDHRVCFGSAFLASCRRLYRTDSPFSSVTQKLLRRSVESCRKKTNTNGVAYLNLRISHGVVGASLSNQGHCFPYSHIRPCGWRPLHVLPS